MRITAGKFKNKEILSYKDKKGELRPTSSKVRQAVFNLLAHGKFLREVDFITEENPNLIQGRIIADIYCGTGIMGFEAASRGAEKLVFVDFNNQTLNVAKKNAYNINFQQNCYFYNADATRLPKAPISVDVIFMDPPYEMKLAPSTMKSLNKNCWIKKGGVIIVEHSKKEDIAETEQFKLLDVRDYNNTKLSIFKLI